jgi:hypothetical protein
MSLAVALLLIIGCGRPTQPIAYTGNAELAFVQATPTQVQFRIKNRSGNAVGFRGSRGDALGVDPWHFSMECKAAGSVEWDVGPPSIIDGFSKEFEVEPGEDLLIRVSSSYANQYKKGRCRLVLLMFDRLHLTSNEFEP